MEKKWVELQYSPEYPYVDAEVLEDVGDIRFVYDGVFGFSTIFDAYRVVKVYNKGGYNFGEFYISLYKNGADEEKLESVAGIVYNLEDGKVVKSKIDKSNILTIQENDYFKVVKVIFPSVKEGSVLELSYRISSDFFFNLRTWLFQETIPVRFSKYTTAIPDLLDYRIILTGKQASFSQETSDRMSNSSTAIQGKDSYGGSTNTRVATVTFREIINEYTAVNLPPLKQEIFGTSVLNYGMKLSFELKEIKKGDGGINRYSNSWRNVSSLMMNDNNFGNQLEKIQFLTPLVKALNSFDVSDTARVSLSLLQLNSKVKWNGQKGIYTDNDIQKAFQSGSANNAEINLLLVALLKEMDLLAFPILLSTKQHGIVYKEIVQLNQFNYVATAVFLNGTWILIDAGQPNYPLGVLPPECLNSYGLILMDGGLEWLELKPLKSWKVSNELTLKVTSNGDQIGKWQQTLTGYAAFTSASTDNLPMENFSDWPNVNLLETEGIASKGQSVKKTYSVIRKSEDQESHLLFLNSVLFPFPKEQVFKDKDRFSPIIFSYPYQYVYSMQLDIEPTFTVESLPVSQVFALPQKAAVATFNITQKENQITITYIVDIRKYYFEVNEYSALREFISRLIEIQNEQIVLKRSD